MSEIAQLIDELRDYGKERKGEIADLVTRAADALEQLYSGADYKGLKNYLKGARDGIQT